MVGDQAVDSTNNPFKVSVASEYIIIPVAGLNIVADRKRVVQKALQRAMEAQAKMERLYVTVELVPEPTNQYDPMAIAIMLDNEHIGYVPVNQQSQLKEHVPCVHAQRTPATIYKWGQDENVVWCDVRIEAEAWPR